MKLLKNKKFIRKCSIVFAGTLLLTTVVNAASLTKKIDATFRDIKVYYNNQYKTVEQEPFIYNNSVYLPVRAVGELVDKTIEWNSATNSVYVADKAGSASSVIVQELQTQIAAKNFDIAKITAEKSLLEDKVKELEAKIKDQGTSSSGDLKDTLAYIEDKFDYEYSIDWDFKLSETSSRINVEVSFDSRYDDQKWDRLSKSEREGFFRDITKEIRFDFKDTPINGTVVDRRTDKNIGSFNSSRGSSFSYTDNSSHSFDNLERSLVRKYSDIGTDIEIPIDNIKVTGNEDNITFTIYVDLYNPRLKNEWDYAMLDNQRDIRKLMMDLQEDILFDYRYATTQGFVEDLYTGNTLAKFDGTRLQ